MYTALSESKMWQKTKDVLIIIEGYNMASSLLDEKGIDIDVLASNEWQTIRGKNFRISVMKDTGLKFVFRLETKNYVDIENAIGSLSILDIKVHKIIDTQISPAVATFTIDIPVSEDEYRYFAKILELVKIV